MGAFHTSRCSSKRAHAQGQGDRRSPGACVKLCRRVHPSVSHLTRHAASRQGYGFVEFRTEDDSDYAIKIMNMMKLFGKPLRVNKSSQDKKKMDVGANLFIGGLAPEVDEKLLYDTFSAFGTIVQPPKVGQVHVCLPTCCSQTAHVPSLWLRGGRLCRSCVTWKPAVLGASGLSTTTILSHQILPLSACMGRYVGEPLRCHTIGSSHRYFCFSS